MAATIKGAIYEVGVGTLEHYPVTPTAFLGTLWFKRATP